MNDQSLPLKKQPRSLGSSRNVTQDDVVYEHVFDAILEQRLAPTAYTWTPTAAVTYSWNDAANWGGSGFPASSARARWAAFGSLPPRSWKRGR